MSTLHVIELVIVAFVVGSLAGAWAWQKYKAKVAADLVKVVPKV